jgi:hypothetical protein
VRGDDNRTGKLFSYVDLETRVRRDHTLRAIRTIVNEALSALEHEFEPDFATIPIPRPPIPGPQNLRNGPSDPTVDGHAFVIIGYDSLDDLILILMGWGDHRLDWWALFHQLKNVNSYYLVDLIFDTPVSFSQQAAAQG